MGLKQSGLARSAAEAATATGYQVDGVKIAHLAYVYGLNGYTLPPDKPYLVRLTDKGRFDLPMAGPYSADGILSDAKAAKAAGADIVVITMHWGQEYQSKPTDGQVKFLQQTFLIGKRYAGKYVWSTLETAKQTLTVYYQAQADADWLTLRVFPYSLPERAQSVPKQFRRRHG